MTFLVDTGASLVPVSNELALKVGLAPGAPAMFGTAGGPTAGRIVPEASGRVGGIRVDGIRVAVGTGEQALLGQNFLRSSLHKAVTAWCYARDRRSRSLDGYQAND